MKLVLLLLVNFSLLQKETASQSQSCPVFGRNDSLTFPSNREGLFMNFNAPSQCNGTATAWNYCYYRGRGEDGDLLEVKFMVYRQNTTTSGIYNLVPNSLYNLRLNYSDLENNGCHNILLSTTQQFQILQNDVVSACLPTDDNINPLHINRNRRGQEQYRFNRECANDLNSVNTDQERQRQDRLHLHATISTKLSCRAGNNPRRSSFISELREGTFLNTQFPSECDGTVTTWHYCYYPEEANDFTRMYTAIVAVWRLDNTSNQYSQYSVVNESVTELQLSPVNTLARIYCTQELLDPVNYTEIRQGDIVGVYLPTQNPIPMIGRTSDHTMQRTYVYESFVFNIPSHNLSPVNMAIHLYTDISTDHTTGSTSSSITGTENVNQVTNQTSSDSSNSGLDGGGIAGVVILAIVVPSFGVALVVVIVLVLRKKKAKNNSVNFNHSTYNEHRGIHFDNINYTGVNYERGDSGKAAMNATERCNASSSNDLQSSNNFHTESVLYESVRYEASLLSSDNAPIDIESHLIEQNKTKDIYSGLNPYQEPAEHEDQLYSQIHSQPHVVMDINREDIRFVRNLGSGQFGSVDEGNWKNESQEIPVALKTLKKKSSERDKVKFLQEAMIMAQFRHPNVVILYGIVTEGEPIILVVELVAKGDLRQNLLKIRPCPGAVVEEDFPELLLKFCQQIAFGMQYLSGKGFIHRDLAARNILLSDSNKCKIADFGLSRDLFDDNYYTSSGGPVPVKWTAPEAIRFRKYSTASDVWSYGCVLYEIWSLGHKPFENHQNMEILEILESGKRLPPPPGSPRKIYHLMIRCWHPDKSLRPSFRDIVLALTGKMEDILELPENDEDITPQFKNLGADLEAGENVYMDLQTSY